MCCLSSGTYNCPGDNTNSGSTTCDAILCSENYRVSDHMCNMRPVPIMLQEMIQVVQIHIANQYCAMKMNMRLIINVLLVHLGLIMPQVMMQVKQNIINYVRI